jgi:hypothetical protein
VIIVSGRRRRLGGGALTLALYVSCWAAPVIAQPATPPRCPPAAETVSSPTLPPQTVVACVGAQQITEATFRHWYEVAAAAERAANGHRGSSQYEFTTQAMSFLVTADWITDEARDLGVRISAAAVHHTFDHLRHARFHRAREFRSFLRRNKETIADLLLRTELQLLVQGIQRHVTGGHHSVAGKQRALRRFATQFEAKWRSETYCAPGYAVHQCGHVQVIP